jgi:septum formation protein
VALWLADTPLVLASQSASRRAILESAGIPLDVEPAAIDERAVEARADRADPGDIAALLARAKALAVSAQKPGRLVLGADQTLADRAAARDQLKTLRGNTHELHSALALARDGAIVFEHREAARLTMRPFSDDFLERYLDAAGSAVTASVGAYQVEGAGIHLFEHIDGGHFTILGLPLLPLLGFLRRTGALSA